jgi:hypothetical protein
LVGAGPCSSSTCVRAYPFPCNPTTLCLLGYRITLLFIPANFSCSKLGTRKTCHTVAVAVTAPVTTAVSVAVTPLPSCLSFKRRPLPSCTASRSQNSALPLRCTHPRAHALVAASGSNPVRPTQCTLLPARRRWTASGIPSPVHRLSRLVQRHPAACNGHGRGAIVEHENERLLG